MFTFPLVSAAVRRHPRRLVIRDAVVAMVICIVIQLRILHRALLRGGIANKEMWSLGWCFFFVVACLFGFFFFKGRKMIIHSATADERKRGNMRLARFARRRRLICLRRRGQSVGIMQMSETSDCLRRSEKSFERWYVARRSKGESFVGGNFFLPNSTFTFF